MQSHGVRRAGAAAIDLAYVACGRLDFFWEFSLNPWDMAAGTLLILLPPTFDVYPFSYHRLAGLIMLMFATSPTIDIEEYRRNISGLTAWSMEAAKSAEQKAAV